MKIPLTFKWSYLQGDKTEFLQRSIELEPVDLWIVIELDADPKYFHGDGIKTYWEAQKLFELGQGEKPKQILLEKTLLTLEGLKEARRLVNEALLTQHPYAENHKDDWDENDESDDDW